MKTFQQLQHDLSDPAAVRRRGFGLAQDLCQFVTGTENEQQAHELVLRALDLRTHFGSAGVVVDGLAREVGLFPYLDPERLSFADLLAYEGHRPDGLPGDIVMHHPQAVVYRALLDGVSVILSAPTSFGKSLVVDAVLASRRYKNVVIVVPTLALIDETRRRLVERFRGVYKVITHRSQSPAERNIYVLTQERVLEVDRFDDLDLFVIDEFYKLDPTDGDDDRALLLNQAFYRLNRRSRQFYMLGPFIQSVSEAFFNRIDCRFIVERYTTVVSELYHRERGIDEFAALVELCRELKDPTIIYCRSPARAAEVARRLVQEGFGLEARNTDAAADWVATHYHPDWHFGVALRQGIGVHHGRIPRSLGQYIVRLFNAEQLPFLVCTSTLIEGVNTRAKNIIVFDNRINRTPLDLFTFNNIRGRSGRMMQHFVGRVYVFHNPPESGLPEVDVPVITQPSHTPESLLIQIEDEDLTAESRRRLQRFANQQIVGYDTLRANVGIDLDQQIELAREITAGWPHLHSSLWWTRYPTYDQLGVVCEMIWRHFGGSALGSGSIRSHRQLTLMLWRLRNRPTIRELVALMLDGSSGDADAAVSRVLDFLRLWANFHFPRLLRAVDRIQRDVFARLRPAQPAGNYEFSAASVENFFLDPTLVALDEYGLPLEIARSIEADLQPNGDLDAVLNRLRALVPGRLPLTAFEQSMIRFAQEGL
jgi:hypothetical protein